MVRPITGDKSYVAKSTKSMKPSLASCGADTPVRLFSITTRGTTNACTTGFVRNHVKGKSPQSSEAHTYPVRRLRGPVPHEFAQALQSQRKLASSGSKAKPKMRRKLEAIPRGEQNSLLRSRPAEWPGVLSADQPGKRRHSTQRTNPAKNAAMPRHEPIQMLQVPCGSFLRFPENHIAPPHRDFSK